MSNDADRDLEDVVDQARAAWPSVQAIAPTVFAAWIAERVPPGTTLASLPTDDLYLACACAAADPRALAEFETHYLREVDIAAARVRAAPGLLDEARQRVRALLFVPRPNAAPAIGTYTGQGDLRGWVRVIAMREVLRLTSAGKREVAVDDEDLLDALSPADDPELEHLKSHYRETFGQAFRDALAALGARERTMLRHVLLDGLGIDALAKLYDVHRATAARWLVAAREAVLDGTRSRLALALRISGPEAESVLRLVKSRLDVSIERLLRD
jgi:RNA polymerase sigma-70 factor (ECF subfamily)